MKDSRPFPWTPIVIISQTWAIQSWSEFPLFSLPSFFPWTGSASRSQHAPSLSLFFRPFFLKDTSGPRLSPFPWLSRPTFPARLFFFRMGMPLGRPFFFPLKFAPLVQFFPLPPSPSHWRFFCGLFRSLEEKAFSLSSSSDLPLTRL